MVEHVLRAVEAVPPGRVTTYGAVAELVGATARQVGSVMRYYGSNVTWWRVVSATGELPDHLRTAAAEQWEREGIECKSDGRGCRVGDYRVDPLQWGERYAEAASDLPRYERTPRR
ncbi:MGMT family protein [Gephyromycinifex aptenodytis]|uniref:MGMT family protein n=1 Tax=Gephyromycinifex aptenodytis TaxID=2716227 RepID=UPI001D009530|nr:MGMT family protein [Gephyromycinifex aptenodytis]